jgi:hypothetical protein
MKKSNTWLLDYKHDIYSQSGEDGIISKILEIIPQKDKWCLEFGAWNGLYLSNTRNLIENFDYSAILIEANKKRYEELRKNYLNNPKVLTVNQLVGFNNDDSLDLILKNTSIPLDFDFISIDIDGNDYHVWKAMTKYKPKVVCIEFNTTIPNEVRYVQERDINVTHGSDLTSLCDLGREKGYKLVSVISCNAIFVKEEYFHLFQIADSSPEILRTDYSLITFLFIGYDGSIHLKGNLEMPWHGIKIKESRVQQLPACLREYSGNYSFFQKVLFRVFSNYLRRK